MSRPVLLIAGGSRGIGASTARLAGVGGYDVAVNYKTNANAAAGVVNVVKASGGKAVAIQGIAPAFSEKIRGSTRPRPKPSARSLPSIHSAL
jgi:NAD(P)-dependent dehydrogenase (short-subunit alcohol dehydrogenase family)